MTLLEFVCEQLLGAPTRTGAPGESFWPCPNCGHPRWHTMPHSAGYKDRFRCWTCAFRGDVFDLLLRHFPGENFAARQVRVGQYQLEYDRLKASAQLDGAARRLDGDGVGGIPSRGAGIPQATDPREIEMAWADLAEDDCEKLIAALAVMRSKAKQVPFEELADYCLTMAVWQQQERQDAVIDRLMAQDERAARKPHPVPKRKPHPVPKRRK